MYKYEQCANWTKRDYVNYAELAAPALSSSMITQ